MLRKISNSFYFPFFREPVRKRAAGIIKQLRQEEQENHVRKFVVPQLRFEATDYTELID